MKSNSPRRSRKASPRQGHSTERWEFSTSSEHFMPLGSGDNLRGITIRMPDGQYRFLPL